MSTRERIDYLVDKLNKWTNKFPLPKKLEDGSWTAGWWDIRDWY